MSLLIVRHRVNQLKDCAQLPDGWGAEIDLRSWKDEIILNHEPFEPGDSLDDFLKIYGTGRKGPLIFNPKEDGLETAVIERCSKLGLENYFFLDLPIPTMVRLARQGFHRLALRISEYEPIEVADFFQGLAEWVWLDCFTGRVPGEKVIRTLQSKGFRVCMVSPELQKYSREKTIEYVQACSLLSGGGDAVCTKFPELWVDK